MPEITTETIAWRKFFIADPAVYKNIDGQRVRLPEAGINLGDGGRASASSGGGLRLDFPDGAILLVTPGWWSAQQLWYLNISVLGSRAEAGIMGVRAAGSWLPALPDGTSLGMRPPTASGRYEALYKDFADAWRDQRDEPVRLRAGTFDHLASHQIARSPTKLTRVARRRSASRPSVKISARPSWQTAPPTLR